MTKPYTERRGCGTVTPVLSDTNRRRHSGSPAGRRGLGFLFSLGALVATLALVEGPAITQGLSYVSLAHHTSAASDVLNAAAVVSLYEIDSEQPDGLQLATTSRVDLPDGGTIVVSAGNHLVISSDGQRFCVVGTSADGQSVFYDSVVAQLRDTPTGPSCQG